MSEFFELTTWLFSLDGRIWSASFLNVGAIAFGIREVIIKDDASGVSSWMLVIFLYMQATYAQAGFQNEMWGQFYGMFISALLTTFFIFLKLFREPLVRAIRRSVFVVNNLFRRGGKSQK